MGRIVFILLQSLPRLLVGAHVKRCQLEERHQTSDSGCFYISEPLAANGFPISFHLSEPGYRDRHLTLIWRDLPVFREGDVLHNASSGLTR